MKSEAIPVEGKISIEELARFCKRRGFVYPSGEIYGSLAGFWDFGHLGVELKNNIKQEWWRFHVQQREDIVGIDGAIITNPRVWEASGHLSSFVDIVVVCKNCGYATKLDKHQLGKVRCEKCKGEYEQQQEFNPMFTTAVGPVRSDSVTAYLRPETAQLIFSNFKFVQENARLSLPFGIAQIGKAFRNEISPREFIFRSREFEQMEIEYFIASKQECPFLDNVKDVEIALLSEEAQKKNLDARRMNVLDAYRKGLIATDWHAYWLALEYSWFISLGADAARFRARQHTSDERSHYSRDTWDLEYLFPMGWRELQGFANRADFDLRQHEKYSKKSFEIIDPHYGRIVPQVVCEPSLGVERAFLVFLLGAYTYDKKRENIVLKLSPKLASYKAAVFPLVTKGKGFEIAQEVYRDLKQHSLVAFDRSGSIGRRYARHDEIGTPFCITIDEDSLEDNSVTIRDRDSTEQIRVSIKDLGDVLRRLIYKEIGFLKAGKVVRTRVK